MQSSATSQHSIPSLRQGRVVVRRFDPPHDSPPDTQLTFLPEVIEKLRTQENPAAISDVVRRLFVECKRLRDHLAPDEWSHCVKQIRDSSLLELVHQDPFTHRAFTKPRGYAGDAVMMDYIYGVEEDWTPPNSSALGAGVFQYTTSAAASAGVRSRREFIAEKLDEVARTTMSPDVLAIACGHLREASMSSAVRRGKFGRFVASDADAESLGEVDRAYGRLGVSTQIADIRKMLTGKLDFGTFDLVYSTGLYDYLNEKIGKRLTYHLFSMLKPGGKLVVANFLPTIDDIGYMEACMDWFLIYRDRIDMIGLTELIDQSEIRDIRVSVEENQNIIFLEITRN